MVDQYIHTLSFTTGDIPSSYDESTGKYTQATPGTLTTISCRARPSGSGKKAKKQDGTETDYAFDLGFPIESTVLPAAGQEVELKGVEGERLWKGSLIRIQNGIMSVRGWL